MTYSHAGSSRLFLSFDCVTSNFIYFSFSTLHSSFLCKIDGSSLFNQIQLTPDNSNLLRESKKSLSFLEFEANNQK